MTDDGTRWYDRAACLGMAPLFDAEGDGNRNGRHNREWSKAVADRYTAAARVCERCPVTRECERDARPGRDEGIRNGKLLPPLFAPQRKAS